MKRTRVESFRDQRLCNGERQAEAEWYAVRRLRSERALFVLHYESDVCGLPLLARTDELIDESVELDVFPLHKET